MEICRCLSVRVADKKVKATFWAVSIALSLFSACAGSDPDPLTTEELADLRSRLADPTPHDYYLFELAEGDAAPILFRVTAVTAESLRLQSLVTERNTILPAEGAEEVSYSPSDAWRTLSEQDIRQAKLRTPAGAPGAWVAREALPRAVEEGVEMGEVEEGVVFLLRRVVRLKKEE